MKYITAKKEDGLEELFLFPRHINHDCMAEVLSYIKNQTYGNWEREYREIVSAGFVTGNLTCYGASESLGFCAREKEDTELLRKQFNL